MAENNLFGFLGEEVEDALPEGGGAFENTGFVGLLMTKRFWNFYNEEDLRLYEHDYVQIEGDVTKGDYYIQETTNGYQYYFLERGPAFDASKILEAWNPRRIWRFEVDTGSVKNFASDSALEAFGQVISQEVSVTTLDSPKYRHGYHMVALPGMVNAMALYAGFIKEPIFNIRELLSGELSNEEFTEKLQARLTGDPGANMTDFEQMVEIYTACGNDLDLAHSVALGLAEVPPEGTEHLAGETRIHYRFSKFWMRRAELWDALGEPNAEAYIPEKMVQTDYGEDYSTDADQLVKCLGAAVRAWKDPIWARFHLVKDPRHDAVSKDGSKRWNLPYVSEIFGGGDAGEAKAAKAAKEELESRGQDSTGSSSAPSRSSSDGLSIPEAWEGYEEDWKAEIKREKDEHGDLPPVPVLKKMANTLSVEPAEIEAWWNEV